MCQLHINHPWVHPLHTTFISHLYNPCFHRFVNGKLDDVRLPFSILDPIVRDVFSVLWEPEMIMETGSTIKILTSEILSQLGQTILQQTVMTALMGALQRPISKSFHILDDKEIDLYDSTDEAGVFD